MLKLVAINPFSDEDYDVLHHSTIVVQTSSLPKNFARMGEFFLCVLSQEIEVWIALNAEAARPEHAKY